jgi:hypothetical protein
MDPFTIALIASVGISILGEIMGAGSKKQALERQANFEESQAAIALQDAAYDVWRTQMQGASKVGAGKAAYATSGVDTGSGSAVDTLAQLATVKNMDAYQAELRGTRIAWTHKQRAAMLRAGVDDVDAALPLNIASDVIGAASKYSAIGSPANKKTGGGITIGDGADFTTLGNIMEPDLS